MKEIFLATKNKGKIREMKEILKDLEDIKVYSMCDGFDTPDVIEDGDTFEYNSKKKAVEIAKHLNMYVIADDSGIEIEALGKRPGVYSARYAGENATDDDNNRKLLEELKGHTNRKATYKVVITIANPEGDTKCFEGDVSGVILEKEEGTGGFGYDPLFYVEEYGKTFGEIEPEIKNKISHRGKALAKLKKEIKQFIKK